VASQCRDSLGYPDVISACFARRRGWRLPAAAGRPASRVAVRTVPGCGPGGSRRFGARPDDLWTHQCDPCGQRRSRSGAGLIDGFEVEPGPRTVVTASLLSPAAVSDRKQWTQTRNSRRSAIVARYSPRPRCHSPEPTSRRRVDPRRGVRGSGALYGLFFPDLQPHTSIRTSQPIGHPVPTKLVDECETGRPAWNALVDDEPGV